MYYELERRNKYPDQARLVTDLRSGMDVLRSQKYRNSKQTKDAGDFLKWFADQLKPDAP